MFHIQSSTTWPASRSSCAEADRAADQQIEGLLDELRKPCPNCGAIRNPEDQS